MAVRAVDLILKKKQGEALSTEEINALISEYTARRVPDYQMAALLMAICFRGMNERETFDLTMAMVHSGDVVDLSAIPGIKVDKHSTGGVGDTTTLLLAPLAAACGVPVAKISGRGLGHTGGTLDKLESVRGVSVSMEMERFVRVVQESGLAVIGQTANLVPADKMLYALRDVTGTVDSIPLIASSIMSKKIAAGSDAIVLDVKTGSGAFMHEKEDAFALAREMVRLGRRAGRKTVAVVTDMNQPLGMAVGNAIEVRETILALSGKIPPDDPLIEVVLLLGTQMLRLSGVAKTDEEAREKLLHALQSGAGLEKFRALLCALGGDGRCCDDPDSLLRARRTIDIPAPCDGYVSGMNALEIGEASLLLGAGRATKEDKIDPDVGLIMNVRVGSPVRQGEPLARFYVNDETNLDAAKEHFLQGIFFANEPVERPPMVYGVVREEA